MLIISFGVPSSVPPLGRFRSPLPYLGSAPLRDNVRSRLLTREYTFSRYVPPSGFLNLSAVYSDSERCGLVPSRSHVQGSFRPGVSPDPQPPQLIAGSFPHEVGFLPLTGRHEDCQLPLPVASSTRPCSVNRCVLQGRGLAFPSVAPLFGFCPPSGLRLRTVYPIPRAIRSWHCSVRS